MPNSRIMIHQPLGGASGQAVDIEIQAKEIMYHKVMTTVFISLLLMLAFCLGATCTELLQQQVAACCHFVMSRHCALLPLQSHVVPHHRQMN
jgi:hypothetical protein